MTLTFNISPFVSRSVRRLALALKLTLAASRPCVIVLLASWALADLFSNDVKTERGFTGLTGRA